MPYAVKYLEKIKMVIMYLKVFSYCRGSRDGPACWLKYTVDLYREYSCSRAINNFNSSKLYRYYLAVSENGNSIQHRATS